MGLEEEKRLLESKGLRLGDKQVKDLLVSLAQEAIM
jgi:hypothetical protein